MEMEISINQDCQHLLNRIRTSNIQPFFPKTRSKSDKDSRLQSLSVQKRKVNQSLQRQHSLTTGFYCHQSSGQTKQKTCEKPSLHPENTPVAQPQFNLRKGTKIINPIKPLRQPFANLTNVNKFRLTLNRDKPLDKRSLSKAKASIEQSLHVNGLNKNYQQQIQYFSQNSKQKPVMFTPYSSHYQDDSDNAVENASKVNQIYHFIKEKARLEGQEINQFTQIVFKLSCYFFVSYTTQNGTRINFDPRKMIDFIEREIHQSYSALNNFKKSRKQGFSNENVRSSNGNVADNPQPNFVRKNNRVSSFFKSVQHSESQSNENNESRLQSLRKYNAAMSMSEDLNPNSHSRNNLKIPQNNGNRRLSIVLNSVKEDNEQHSQAKISNRTLTERSNTNIQTIEQSYENFTENSNQHMPTISYRVSMTSRKSCFLTEMNRLGFQKQISQGQVLHGNQSQRPNIKKINSLGASKNSSGSDLVSQNQLKSVVSYLGLSNHKIQDDQQKKDNTIKSKESIKSKVNLNLSTPYDFMKQDNLMTKRRKYLELHQQITKMTDEIDELKKQEQQITERIQVKDSQLINMENKLIDINQEIQTFETRSKEAKDFLNSNQCPQMVQKIIKKNIELKKNLTCLLNSHAWQTSNLTQSSHAQHIFTTKQSSMDKLNSLTRKFRGCKNLQNIESLVGEMRDIFLFTVERYSEIIEEFQDKLRQSEEERSNMLKNLEDWEIENKIKEKLLNSSFLDYYSVERKVAGYIEKLPEYLRRLQQSVYALSHQRKADYVVGASDGNDSKNSARTIQKSSSEVISKKILMMEKEMVGFLDKMLGENGVICTELPKQKKFAMVLEKIV